MEVIAAQVCFGFDADESEGITIDYSHPEGIPQKRQTVADGCSVIAKHHRAWCQRGSGASQKSEWRPCKVHRIASKHVLQYTDNQLHQTRGGLGWKDFQYKEDDPTWSTQNWHKWPSIAAGLDQGSDGMCATLSLEYRFDANLRKWFDSSHGAHKDLHKALHDAGLFDFILTMMISANIPWA